jgi:hypothetical protein
VTGSNRASRRQFQTDHHFSVFGAKKAGDICERVFFASKIRSPSNHLESLYTDDANPKKQTYVKSWPKTSLHFSLTTPMPTYKVFEIR